MRHTEVVSGKRFSNVLHRAVMTTNVRHTETAETDCLWVTALQCVTQGGHDYKINVRHTETAETDCLWETALQCVTQGGHDYKCETHGNSGDRLSLGNGSPVCYTGRS